MASLLKNLRLARHGASYIKHRLGAMRTFSSNSTLLTGPQLLVKSQSHSEARIIGPRAFHKIAPGTKDAEPIFVRLRRMEPPYYSIQIDSFSKIYKYKIDEFETGVFEADGYKWALRICPEEYWLEDQNLMLVKLALADPSALPKNWELNAHFSIFLKNQTDGSYHMVYDMLHLVIDAKNPEFCGFVPNHILRDPKHGYLKNDTCVFGADLCVIKKDVISDYVSLKNFKHPLFKQEFEIPNIHSLYKYGGWVSHETWTSQVFRAAGRDWKLKVCPKGWGDSAGRLSIFLENVASRDDKNNDSRGEFKASFTITLTGQFAYEDDVKNTCAGHFSASGGYHQGWNSFIDLVTLNDPAKGYTFDDISYLELELSVEEDEDIIPSSTSSSA